jgi:hypothetical protein
MNVIIEANNCCFRENIGITYKVRFNFTLTTMPDSLQFLKGGSTLFNMLYLQQF